MTGESLYPRLEPLLAQVEQAHPVRRRRAQRPGQGVGRRRRALGADVPRRLRGGAAQPGPDDPLRGAQRAPRRPRRAHLRRLARPRRADAASTASRSSPSTRTAPSGDFDLLGVSFATELGYTNLLEALDLAGIPLHAADRDETLPGRRRRRARRVQPRAGRRLRRLPPSSATASRWSARSPTSSRRGRRRAAPAGASSCWPGWPGSRASTCRASTRSPTRPTARSPRSPAPATTSRRGSASAR